MIGDPNWLYSTIAQSSAAIVAIVGGFITATVLMLMAEKRSLENQISAKKAELRGLKKPLPLLRKDKAPPEELQGRKELVESNRIKISLLEAAISDLETRLSTFSYPPNLVWGIPVLGSLIILGIFLPVYLIYNQLYVNIARIAAMTAFFTGILIIFVYIVSLINILRRPPNAAG